MDNEENIMNENEPIQDAPETFSFFDVVNEITYPTDVVSVFLDEKAAHEYGKLQMEIAASGIDIDGGEYETDEDRAKGEEFKNRAQAIAQRLNNSKYTFYLKGVSDDKIYDIGKLVEEHFAGDKKPRKNANGQIENILPDDKRMDYMRYLDASVVAVQIEQIVDPKGRVMTAPSADEIANFLDKAPNAAQNKVRNAVKNLRVESAIYEASIDEGFLAKP